MWTPASASAARLPLAEQSQVLDGLLAEGEADMAIRDLAHKARTD